LLWFVEEYQDIIKENRTMKRYGCFLITAIVAVSLSGCMSPSGRPDYTASGALAGGATGAIIGSFSRHPGAPLVGAAVGALAGGLIGHSMDQAQEEQLRAQAPQTLERIEHGQPLTVQDVKALTNAGVSDDVIISQIRNSRTVYHLTTSDIIDLKNSGVSANVIDYMINTPSEVQTARVAPSAGTPPPPPAAEQVYMTPGPDYVWVGGAWVWGGTHWVWHSGYWYRPMRSHVFIRIR
jgi:hypothetical protein